MQGGPPITVSRRSAPNPAPNAHFVSNVVFPPHLIAAGTGLPPASGLIWPLSAAPSPLSR